MIILYIIVLLSITIFAATPVLFIISEIIRSDSFNKFFDRWMIICEILFYGWGLVCAILLFIGFIYSLIYGCN